MAESKEPWAGELPEREGGMPESESGLAEAVELLRSKGLSNRDIVKEVLKRDINVSLDELSQILSMEKTELGLIKGPISKAAKKAAEKLKAVEKGEGGAHGEEDKSILRGEVDANRILERILAHPDVPAKVKGDIMLLAEDTSGGIHPQALVGILLGYKGMTQNLANFLAMRYNMALTKASQEGKIQQWPINPSMMGVGQGPQPGWGGMGWGQQAMQNQPPGWGPQPQQSSWGPQPGYGPGGYTERDISRFRQDWDKEKKLETLERSLADLVRDLPNTIKNAMPQVEGQYEEVTEYIDKNGKLCGDPEKAFSLRSIRRPIISAPRESSDVKALSEKVDSLTKSLQDRTIGDIQKSIKDLSDKVEGAGKRPEESPEIRDLKVQLDQTRKSLDEMKETMASKDREQLLRTIESLDQRISHLTTTSGEWKTDEAKLIASELGEIGGIAREIAKRDRMGLIRDIIIPGTGQPPTAIATEEARGEVIDELRKHGYTARVIER